MKKKLLSLAAIAALTLNISACATKQEIKEVKDKSVCPVLNVENTTQEQFDEAKGLIISLQSTVPSVATVYTDILKHYNNVDNVDKYISKNTFIDVGSNTAIYLTLISMKNLSSPLDTLVSAGTDEEIAMYKKAYEEVLNTIDANNPNWCELESYKHITDKYKININKKEE